MIEIAQTLQEVTKAKDFLSNELNNKLSPSELLGKGEEKGITGSIKEINNMKFEIEKFERNNSILPKENGEWSDKEGDSIWYPDKEEIPKRPYENEKTWGEILDEYKIDGIVFKDGEPDFSPVSEESVQIADFSTDRNSNFTQADEKLSEQWSLEKKDGKEWLPQDIKEYRKDNNLSWHERSDMETMDLVPQEVHGNIPHSGGISAAKNNLKGILL